MKSRSDTNVRHGRLEPINPNDERRAIQAGLDEMTVDLTAADEELAQYFGFDEDPTDGPEEDIDTGYYKDS